MSRDYVRAFIEVLDLLELDVPEAMRADQTLSVELLHRIRDAVALLLVDKTDLSAVIDEAEALTEATYTPESWAVLAAALTAANTVLADAAALQPAVDAAQTTLAAAIIALVEA